MLLLYTESSLHSRSYACHRSVHPLSVGLGAQRGLLGAPIVLATLGSCTFSGRGRACAARARCRRLVHAAAAEDARGRRQAWRVLLGLIGEDHAHRAVQ